MVRKRNRHTTRLRGYDYSQAGVYFVTVCVRNRECLFGKIIDGKMNLNQYGRIAKQQWVWLFHQYPYCQLHEYVIMPNHMHGIIIINHNCRGGSRTAPTKVKPLGRLIGAFKTTSAKLIHHQELSEFAWQRNYYDRIIRNQKSLYQARQYIRNNPAVWEDDVNYIKL